MNKNLQLLRFSFLCIFGLLAISVQVSAQCVAGEVQTTGEVDVPEGMNFGFEVINDTIPMGGGFGLIFDNTNTDGIGGIGAPLIATNIMQVDSIDADVNGLLSTNNLPPLVGTWVVRGAAYADATIPAMTICSITADSLVVTFGGEIDLTCSAGNLQTVGTDIVCEGESFDLEVTDFVVPTGGAMGWFFLINGGTGTGSIEEDFLLVNTTGMETYDVDLNGILSDNALPEMGGTWVVKAATYSNPANAFGSICELSADSLIVTFNPAITASIENNFNTSLTVTASGGTSPYTYLWSNGDTEESTTSDLIDGTMTVVVTDANGCEFTESIELMNTAVEDIEGLLNYGLFPNPTDGITHLELGFEEATIVNIQIVGIDGKVIETVLNERTTGGVYDLDMSSYNTGLYLIQISTDTGRFAERLFVK
jgi:hypothetical protein